MRNSYLILDENMCFLNCPEGTKRPTISILENIDQALSDSGWDTQEYADRGARYDWSGYNEQEQKSVNDW